MANPVVVDFIVRGMPDVQRAMRGVVDAAAAAERANTANAARAAKERQAIAEKEAREKVRLMVKWDKERARAQDKAQRDTARAASKRQRDEEREMQAMIRAAEKAGAERVRIAAKVDREIRKMEAARARENDRILREGQRLEEKQHRAAARAQFIQERDEMRNRRRFAGVLGGAVDRGLQAGGRRIVGLAQQATGMVTQLGGGFSIADSVQRNVKDAGAMGDLLNSAINPFSAIAGNRKRADRSKVEGVVDQSAAQYGLERSDAIQGLQDFTGITGDLQTATVLLPQLAELARATGAKLSDLAQEGGNVATSLEGITDSGEKAEKVMAVLRSMSGMGKAGSVENKDLAVQMGKLVASAGKFEGDNVENIMRMGMLAQAARGGGGAWNAASAATSVTAFTSTFGKGARLNAFKGMGIDVFADKDKTKIRAPEQLIAEALEKTKGNANQMNDLFGSVFSLRAVSKFTDVFHQGYTNKDGKVLKGKEGVLAYAHEMISRTAMSKGDVTSAATARTQEIDAKLMSQQVAFDKAVRERVIPALLGMVPALESMSKLVVDVTATGLPAFVDLVRTVAKTADEYKGWLHTMAEHPIGTILAMEVGKSIATAGLGQVFAVGLQKAMGDAGLGSVFSRLLSTQLGQAGLIVGAATIAVTAGMIAIDKEYKAEDDVRAKSRNDATEAATLAARMQNGTATPEDRARAASLAKELAKDQAAERAVADNPGFFKSAGGAIAGLIDPDIRKQEQEQQAQQAKLLADAMKSLETALRSSAAGDKPGPAGNDGAPKRTQPITNRN